MPSFFSWAPWRFYGIWDDPRSSLRHVASGADPGPGADYGVGPAPGVAVPEIGPGSRDPGAGRHADGRRHHDPFSPAGPLPEACLRGSRPGPVRPPLLPALSGHGGGDDPGVDLF